MIPHSIYVCLKPYSKPCWAESRIDTHSSSTTMSRVTALQMAVH